MLDGLSFALCYICSLSTYDIVITTYSLLAKEIPTAKQDEQIPGANPSVEVRRGPCWGSRVGTADNRSLFTASEMERSPSWGRGHSCCFSCGNSSFLCPFSFTVGVLLSAEGGDAVCCFLEIMTTLHLHWSRCKYREASLVAVFESLWGVLSGCVLYSVSGLVFWY